MQDATLDELACAENGVACGTVTAAGRLVLPSDRAAPVGDRAAAEAALRDRTTHALHLGRLQPGARLSSARRTAEELGVDRRAEIAALRARARRIEGGAPDVPSRPHWRAPQHSSAPGLHATTFPARERSPEAVLRPRPQGAVMKLFCSVETFTRCA